MTLGILPILWRDHIALVVIFSFFLLDSRPVICAGAKEGSRPIFVSVPRLCVHTHARSFSFLPHAHDQRVLLPPHNLLIFVPGLPLSPPLVTAIIHFLYRLPHHTHPTSALTRSSCQVRPRKNSPIPAAVSASWYLDGVPCPPWHIAYAAFHRLSTCHHARVIHQSRITVPPRQHYLSIPDSVPPLGVLPRARSPPLSRRSQISRCPLWHTVASPPPFGLKAVTVALRNR